MQKIMFNDKYGLTKAVLDERKTQTRRLFTLTLHKGNLHDELQEVYPDEVFLYEGTWLLKYKGKVYEIPKRNCPVFKIGEVVAVAQSYKDCGGLMEDGTPRWDFIASIVGTKNAGWSNKMFVKPELMPHQIRITNVRVERLHDISDEDCFAEGVIVNEPKIEGGIKSYYPCEYFKQFACKVGWGRVFDSPQKAYAELIDKVSRKGTWNKNPYVWVYDFELIK